MRLHSSRQLQPLRLSSECLPLLVPHPLHTALCNLCDSPPSPTIPSTLNQAEGRTLADGLQSKIHRQPTCIMAVAESLRAARWLGSGHESGDWTYGLHRHAVIKGEDRDPDICTYF